MEVVIKGTKISKAGTILLEIKGSAECADKLEEELKIKLAEGVQVKHP